MYEEYASTQLPAPKNVNTDGIIFKHKQYKVKNKIISMQDNVITVKTVSKLIPIAVVLLTVLSLIANTFITTKTFTMIDESYPNNHTTAAYTLSVFCAGLTSLVFVVITMITAIPLWIWSKNRVEYVMTTPVIFYAFNSLHSLKDKSRVNDFARSLFNYQKFDNEISLVQLELCSQIILKESKTL